MKPYKRVKTGWHFPVNVYVTFLHCLHYILILFTLTVRNVMLLVALFNSVYTEFQQCLHYICTVYITFQQCLHYICTVYITFQNVYITFALFKLHFNLSAYMLLVVVICYWPWITLLQNMNAIFFDQHFYLYMQFLKMFFM